MAAQTFTVLNNGNTGYNITGINFSTPAGTSHRADLRNFTGGVENYTASSYSGTTSLPAGQSKTFTVDYLYVSGPDGTRSGSITINTDAAVATTITTTILVGAGGGVSIINPLPGQGTYTASSQNSVDGRATIYLIVGEDGRFLVNAEVGNDLNAAWTSPFPSSVGNDYWVRFTRQSITASGSFFASFSTGWLQLDQDRSIFATASGQTNGNNSTVNATYLVEISSSSSGSPVVASGTYTLIPTGNRQGLVFPLLDIYSSIGTAGTVGVQFNRNGTRVALGNSAEIADTPWYLNGTSTVGDSYYIRATYVGGSFTNAGSALNTWLLLNQNRNWTLSSGSNDSSILFFEISTAPSSSGIVSSCYGYLNIYTDTGGAGGFEGGGTTGGDDGAPDGGLGGTEGSGNDGGDGDGPGGVGVGGEGGTGTGVGGDGGDG